MNHNKLLPQDDVRFVATIFVTAALNRDDENNLLLLLFILSVATSIWQTYIFK